MALIHNHFRLRVARHGQRIFGQQREKRVVRVIALLFGESEQTLVEAGVFALHFVRGATAVHPEQRNNQRHGDDGANPEEQQGAAQQQRRSSERRARHGAHNDASEQQRHGGRSGGATGPREQPETPLQLIQILCQACNRIHAAPFLLFDLPASLLTNGLQMPVTHHGFRNRQDREQCQHPPPDFRVLFCIASRRG